MYSFPNLEPACCSMSSSNCCFLTCIQVFQEAGQVVWYSHLLKNFPQFAVIYTVKGFGVINKAEVDVSNLISGALAFSQSILNIWNFMVHVQLMPGLENFEHCFASAWDECNHAAIWTVFGIALLWDWSENWPFSVLCPLLSFANLLAYWVSSSFQITLKCYNC